MAERELRQRASFASRLVLDPIDNQVNEVMSQVLPSIDEKFIHHYLTDAIGYNGSRTGVYINGLKTKIVHDDGAMSLLHAELHELIFKIFMTGVRRDVHRKSLSVLEHEATKVEDRAYAYKKEKKLLIRRQRDEMRRLKQQHEAESFLLPPRRDDVDSDGDEDRDKDNMQVD